MEPIPEFPGRALTILDGGLATALERRGFDLRHELWSARLLIENPDAIRQVHLEYARAGADVVTTATYQASLEGFSHVGCTAAESRRLFQRAVELAQVSDEAGRRVLVAASIGPYGAFLADGSEYSGNYGLTVAELKRWHRPRFELLQESDADLLAIETIPSFPEALALAELLDDYGNARAWFSFTCRDGAHLRDGTPLEEALEVVAKHPQVLAVGANCVPPSLAPEILRRARSVTEKPVVLYPNGAEGFDRERGEWLGALKPEPFAQLAREWAAEGAAIIGGCCGTGPETIAFLARAFRGSVP